MRDIDNLDRKILFELDRNSRQSFSQLARKVKQGRDRVEYRYQTFVQEKIIRGCVASVDLYKLGFTLFKTYVSLELDREAILRIVQYLSEHPRIYWLARTDGSWDLIFAVFAKTPSEFYQIQGEILSDFHQEVLSFATYTLVDYKMLGRRYLIDASYIQSRLGGTVAQNKIDKLDYQLLQQLAQNARYSATQLADICGSTPTIVRSRISRLEKNGIITGYHLDMNLRKLGKEIFKAQLFLRKYDLGLRDQFIRYCSDSPHIIYYMEQVGDCNLELEFEVSSYGEYTKSIEGLREEYPQLIRQVTTVLIRDNWLSPVPTWKLV